MSEDTRITFHYVVATATVDTWKEPSCPHYSTT